MALTERRRHTEEEGESVFISMTDLMISILFIVMIVMAFFAKYARETTPEIDDLQNVVRTLQTENVTLRAELKKANQDLETRINQEDRIVALREDNLRLRTDLARIQRENDSLSAEIEKLIERNRKLVATNDQLRKDNAKLTRENEELAAANKRLEKEKKNLDDEVRRLRDRLRVLQTELDELRKKFDTSPLDRALRGITEDRKVLLQSVRERLRKANIKVIVDEVSGVIRFGEDAIQFGSNKSVPDERSAANMKKIAEVLAEELRCFTMGKEAMIDISCNPHASIVDAVQIEGHTDAMGTPTRNLILSTERATTTYGIMANHRPALERYLNANYILSEAVTDGTPGQQVLSVSGYGETRLIDRDGPEDNPANRRIDIRIIMTTPKNITEVEKLKSAVLDAVEKGRNAQ